MSDSDLIDAMDRLVNERIYALRGLLARTK